MRVAAVGPDIHVRRQRRVTVGFEVVRIVVLERIERVRQRVASVQRVAHAGVALALQLHERGVDRDELLDRADALLAHAGVGRATVDRQPEIQRPGLGRRHTQLGRLHDDRAVGAVAAQHGST